MDALTSLVEAIHADPGDDTAWLAAADCLEESGRPDRAELVRVQARLRRSTGGAERPTWEARMQALLAAGVEPLVPQRVFSVGPGVQLRLALIPPGVFLLGSAASEPGRYDDETPQQQAAVPRGFYLGVYQVTQQQFAAVTGRNPSRFAGDHNPVECVGWTDCLEFCKKASDRLGRAARLPTEVEWEYACRAGTSTPFHFGDSLSSDLANIDGNYPTGSGRVGRYLERPCAVGSYAPNPWGLYDMHGNVLEWCVGCPERYDPGPAWSRDWRQVLRGGSWFSAARNARSACRHSSSAPERSGFRVLVEPG